MITFVQETKKDYVHILDKERVSTKQYNDILLTCREIIEKKKEKKFLSSLA